MTGQDLRSVAADKPALRIALHENCIYGAPCWSVHDGSYRVVARAAPQGPNEASPPPALELWSMAPSGAEQAQLTGPEAAEHARRLAGYAVALRGEQRERAAAADLHVVGMGPDGDHLERLGQRFGMRRHQPGFVAAIRKMGLIASNRMRSSCSMPRAMLTIQ
jgi:hypothetical protein